jgi:hypothetical protein
MQLPIQQPVILSKKNNNKQHHHMNENGSIFLWTNHCEVWKQYLWENAKLTIAPINLFVWFILRLLSKLVVYMLQEILNDVQRQQALAEDQPVHQQKKIPIQQNIKHTK